jgi:disulfide bond formation protein DsbB
MADRDILEEIFIGARKPSFCHFTGVCAGMSIKKFISRQKINIIVLLMPISGVLIAAMPAGHTQPLSQPAPPIECFFILPILWEETLGVQQSDTFL